MMKKKTAVTMENWADISMTHHLKAESMRTMLPSASNIETMDVWRDSRYKC
jgi:hypothetical protein